MTTKKQSPDAILLTRMNLCLPADSPIRFSVLEFPYAQALKAFLDRFEAIYEREYGKSYYAPLSYRQLNGALLALNSGLIHGFEGKGGGRMAAFTRYVGGTVAEDFPSQESLQGVIKTWLERWRDTNPKIKAVLTGDGKAAWNDLIAAVMDEPETEWQHHITPAEFLGDLHLHDSMAYAALPALLTQLLHGQHMTMVSDKGQEYHITWRRAHDGSKDGLHLVSNPISYRGDYFAYRLDFVLQTQTGRVNAQGGLHPWVFVHVSIQRYVTKTLRRWNSGRNLSILVGNNREKSSGWDEDSTLIRLPIKRDGDSWTWGEGIGGLLDDYAVRRLLSPDVILKQPAAYGNYKNTSPAPEDEYRLVYAEGYKFGDDKGRKHEVKTGMSLRNRSSIVQGLLMLLDGWLQADTELPIDQQTPKTKTYALYDYSEMAKSDKTGKKKAAWYVALKHALQHDGYDHLHIAVLYRDKDEFLRHVMPLMQTVLMGVDAGESPLVTVTPVCVPPLLAHHLDSGGLDPQWKYDVNRPDDFFPKWRKQIGTSFEAKRDQWRMFLQGIHWKPNSRRMVLIDSPGNRIDNEPEADEDDDIIESAASRKAKTIDVDLTIKGAVRDACNCEGISSQFLIGRFRKGGRGRKPDELSNGAMGKIRHAILDLIVRQQGILYAPPSEIYANAAGLNPQIAAQLDVIAFCRVQIYEYPALHYALAVRLRADGEVRVMLPNGQDWLRYDEAAQTVGKLMLDGRVPLSRPKAVSPLRLEPRDLRAFAERVLTKHLERPTLAVIEADRWRDGAGNDASKHGWTQLRNEDLSSLLDELRFGALTRYPRSSDKLKHLLAVVRLRMNTETPQYVTADDFASEEAMRDLLHPTGYIDVSGKLLHYFSIAGLPKTQKQQHSKRVRESFRGDAKAEHDDIAFKHPQLVEMVPFFVHPDFDSHEGRLQLCRCLHLLRISPAFVMGDILLPYPMHLGEALIKDQLCILKPED